MWICIHLGICLYFTLWCIILGNAIHWLILHTFEHWIPWHFTCFMWWNILRCSIVAMCLVFSRVTRCVRLPCALYYYLLCSQKHAMMLDNFDKGMIPAWIPLKCWLLMHLLWHLLLPPQLGHHTSLMRIKAVEEYRRRAVKPGDTNLVLP